MTMQGDVLSTHRNSSGTVSSQRTRVKGFSICAVASQTGTLLLRNGGASGPVLIEIDIPSNSNPNSFYVAIPQQGVLFSTDVYATLTNIASVTVFYG
jgi:hypothetical protein